MNKVLAGIWYGQHPLSLLLRPAAWIFKCLVRLRRRYLTTFRQLQFQVPIIVVGNLSLGGVGKTPLVIALVQAFQAKGIKVGVVSRGYGAEISQFPHELNSQDTAAAVGDEPLLIARSCGCPVVIAPRRVDAVQYLIKNHQSQVVISDDGLQHYRMGRALEIVVIDGQRLFGNGYCLPAGPLREDLSRLKEVDLLVVNGGQWPGAHNMSLKPGSLRFLRSGKLADQALSDPIAAVAGIGNPERFFQTLATLGLRCQPYVFPDHHRFVAADFCFPEKSVVMTEKDAVKCEAFAADNWYVLPVEAQVSDAFWQALWSHERLQGLLK